MPSSVSLSLLAFHGLTHRNKSNQLKKYDMALKLPFTIINPRGNLHGMTSNAPCKFLPVFVAHHALLASISEEFHAKSKKKKRTEATYRLSEESIF